MNFFKPVEGAGGLGVWGWVVYRCHLVRPAVLPDLNAESGASKHSQAVLVVEVLDGVREVGS